MMASAYFPVSKPHLTDSYVKENSNNDLWWMWKTLKLVISEVKSYQDGRFIKALNLQEKDKKELVGM